MYNNDDSGVIFPIIMIVIFCLVGIGFGRCMRDNSIEKSINEKGYYQLDDTTRLYGKISKSQFVETKL